MLRYMTAGESHGKGLIAIVDGVPAGLFFENDCVNKDLLRRMAGYGRGGRMKIEKDKVEIISGCRKNITIGSPVGMLIYNKDYKIDELPEVKAPRPGHADLAGVQKYGFNDARDVLERASARETAARVSAGAVAKAILREFDIKVFSHVTGVGKIKTRLKKQSYEDIHKIAEKSDLRCADPETAALMREEIDEAQKNGDTLGGIFEVVVLGVPAGLGSYAQWDKRLDAFLSGLVMSIPAVKAVSIGAGIESASKKGSKVHDPITYDKKNNCFLRKSNNAGGIEGGISNGLPVVIKGFMKPIATLRTPLESVNLGTKEKTSAATERSDVLAVPACGVVAEAQVAFGIASAFLEKFGADSITEISRNYEAYLKALKEM
ncbi:MAG: chorismate synthase [Candidatus Omnitrophota bacterium]